MEPYYMRPNVSIERDDFGTECEQQAQAFPLGLSLVPTVPEGMQIRRAFG